MCEHAYTMSFEGDGDHKIPISFARGKNEYLF
jgi:hypothetical protein